MPPSTNSTAPRLSVICVTPDHIGTLAHLLDTLRAQTIAAQLEVIIVGPAALATSDLTEWRQVFQQVVCAPIDAPFINAAARAMGVGLATAPNIVFSEDHCFPEPAWAEVLASALEAGADGVAPMMVSANSNTLVASLNFLLEYGPWATVATAQRQQTHLPGHNSAYRRAFLPADPAELTSVLILESPWLWQQAAQGAKLLLDSRARSHHFNFALLGPSLPLRFLGGRLFGASRARNWPLAKRLLAAAALPLIIAVRWRRSLILARHAAPHRGAAFHLLLPGMLALDSLGEVTGYLFGYGNTRMRVSSLEFRRERFTAGVAVKPPFELTTTTSAPSDQ